MVNSRYTLHNLLTRIQTFILICFAFGTTVFHQHSALARDLLDPIEMIRATGDKTVAEDLDKLLRQNGSVAKAALYLQATDNGSIEAGERHFLLGTLQLELGNNANAETELQSAKSDGFSNPALSFLLARAFLQQAKFKQALQQTLL